MEVVAEGLWGLSEYHEKRGEIGKAVKCLEAICQSEVSFFPIIEVKTRLHVATLLLHHSHNINHAKSHLELQQLLLKPIPSCFELKCRAYSLLSQCYHLVGAIAPQKQVLYKGLELIVSAEYEYVLVSLSVRNCTLESKIKMHLSLRSLLLSQYLRLEIQWLLSLHFILYVMLHHLDALVQMRNWFMRFPTLTDNKSMQAMCQVYATVSYICIGDAESSSQALDLIGLVYRVMDSFVGVREKIDVLFAYGLLLMKQQDIYKKQGKFLNN
uniref:Uncharacterized protein n=1 Tax=Cajanus cajan TaxID=3821 RepID=A0A151QL83_CAJCA|nr:hypothetical protein KK1_049150 [Cajanus cajan]